MSQAEAMIRRVSPEGRRAAQRERARAAKRSRRVILRSLLATFAILVLYRLADAVFGPIGAGGFALAIAAMIGSWALIGYFARERVAAPAVDGGDLRQLPDQTGTWLAAQRPALPAPALTVLDRIDRRIEGLAPQIATLDPATPAADDVRKLLARELPGLVNQYRAVPDSLRAEPGAAGVTPDAQLLHGLDTVERQLGELTRQISAGAMDGLATHDRYLDSKYGGPLAG